MRQGVKWIIVAAAAAGSVMGGINVATAQTLQQRVDELEKKVAETQKSAVDFGIKFHGVVALDYLYDLNTPDSGGPTLRAFENEKNSFILNHGNIHIERQPESGLGFVVDLDFGKTADVVNNTTFFGRHDSSGTPITGNGTDFFDAHQFFLTYTVPVGSGIKLKAGRFNTLAGEEVIKAYNNINFNVTNSILFGFAVPFTHTGLMASYSFIDQLSMDLGIVNGWDALADNNDGKSVHGGITIAPIPMISAYISGTYGPEQTHNGHSKRFLTTAVLTVKPLDQLTLIGEYDYGNESNIELVSSPTGSSPGSGSIDSSVGVPGNKLWQGVALYAVWAPADDWQFALRGEVFDDPDGVRTLFQQPGRGPGMTVWELTPTVSYKLVDGLWWRNEYRHDESDKKFFPLNGGFAQGQDTLATELIYTF